MKKWIAALLCLLLLTGPVLASERFEDVAARRLLCRSRGVGRGPGDYQRNGQPAVCAGSALHHRSGPDLPLAGLRVAGGVHCPALFRRGRDRLLCRSRRLGLRKRPGHRHGAGGQPALYPAGHGYIPLEAGGQSPSPRTWRPGTGIGICCW